MKRQSRGWSDEMDSHAIAGRLAIVANLQASWLLLSKARLLTPPTTSSPTASPDERGLATLTDLSMK